MSSQHNGLTDTGARDRFDRTVPTQVWAVRPREQLTQNRFIRTHTHTQNSVEPLIRTELKSGYTMRKKGRGSVNFDRRHRNIPEKN